jgi:hypothetical protein
MLRDIEPWSVLRLLDVAWPREGLLCGLRALEFVRSCFLFQIPVPEVGVFEFHRTAEFVEVGRRSAEQALPELRAALAHAVPLRRRLARWQRRAASLLSLS